jgi:DNA-binding MarR family transcriptional regulator
MGELSRYALDVGGSTRTHIMPQINPPSPLHLLHRAGQRADELFAVSLGDSDITARQFAVLQSVASHDAPSQTLLVEDTGIDRSTLADIVRRLAEKGLVQRRRTRHDARRYAVRLTDKGQAALKAVQPAATSTEEQLLSAVPQPEREAFLDDLRRIAAIMGVGGKHH